MIITTTSNVQGFEIGEYLGLVTGEATIHADLLKLVRADARRIALSGAMKRAIERLREAAEAMGADAVVGVTLRHGTLGEGAGIVLTAAAGTAVRLKRGSSQSRSRGATSIVARRGRGEDKDLPSRVARSLATGSA